MGPKDRQLCDLLFGLLREDSERLKLDITELTELVVNVRLNACFLKRVLLVKLVFRDSDEDGFDEESLEKGILDSFSISLLWYLLTSA